MSKLRYDDDRDTNEVLKLKTVAEILLDNRGGLQNADAVSVARAIGLSAKFLTDRYARRNDDEMKRAAMVERRALLELLQGIVS